MKALSLKKELWIALNTTLFSLLFLPGVIYLVGSRLFSSYQTGLAGFYSDYLQGLALGYLTAWIVALTPAVTVFLIRALLMTKPPKA
jgi:hypothetical protein